TATLILLPARLVSHFKKSPIWPMIFSGDAVSYPSTHRVSGQTDTRSSSLGRGNWGINGRATARAASPGRRAHAVGELAAGGRRGRVHRPVRGRRRSARGLPLPAGGH